MDHFFSNLIVWYAVFLFSATLHEASHSFAAAWGGDYTAYQAGSATLNPLPHIEREKVGMILAPLVTFFLNGGQWMIGWASAPFNPYWAARYPVRSFLMSLAGPLSHIPAVVASYLGMYFGLKTGFFVPAVVEGLPGVVAMGSGGTAAWALSLFLNALFTMNLVLLFFNLMPFPPMDGSNVWYLFIKSEETRLRWQYTAHSYSFAGLLLAWYFFPRIYAPVYNGLYQHLYVAWFQTAGMEGLIR